MRKLVFLEHFAVLITVYKCSNVHHLLRVNIFEPSSLARAYTCVAIMAFTSSNGDLKLE